MNGQFFHTGNPLRFAWLWIPGLFLMGQAPAFAQNVKVPFELGNHAFRYVMHSLELEPRTDESQLDANTILIVLGETDVLDSDKIPGGLADFLKNGGALLVATDRATEHKWQKLFHLHFEEGFIRAPGGTKLAYKDNEECPFVTPTQVQDPPIFQNLRQGVATNRPISLVNSSATLKTLAVFDPRCKAEGRIIRPTQRSPGGLPFAVGGTMGAGRVIVLADHSVFINEMMIQTDNDNFDFAYACVHWLMEGEKRKHVLFLDEGEPVTNFDVPVTLTDVPMPPIEVLNQMLVKLEQEDFFNRLILGNNPGQRMGDILRVLTIVLTTAVTGFGCYHFLHARHHSESGEPLFSTKVAQQSPDVALVTQRHLDMVKADNFWEAAHHLAREWFETVVPGLLVKVAETTGPRSGFLSITVDAGWWRRWAWEKKVKGAWQLAAGPSRKLTAAEFARFVTQLDEIKAAQARGLLHFHNVN